MPAIEILCYSPNNMDEFLAFTKDGTRPDNRKTDSQGREILGVLSWLHARGVPEARFFNNRREDGGAQLFMALVHRTESRDVPWMDNIPGFNDLIHADGLLGNAPVGPFPLLSDLLSTVKSNDELNIMFATKKERLDHVFNRINGDPNPPITRNEIVRALFGDRGTNLQEVAERVRAAFNISL